MDIIQEFGILLMIIVFISFLIKLLKQPIIIGYVLSGIVFSFFAFTGQIDDYMTFFAQLGITFLLFFIGIGFDLKSLKYLGKDLIIAIIIQTIIFFSIAYITSYFFGFNTIECIYISILFINSSTLLVAKWIEDKKETKTLHGKLAIGSLVVLDIVSIIAITALAIYKDSSIGGSSIIELFLIPFYGLILIGIAIIMAKYILNPMLKFASSYPELLFIFSLSICFLFFGISPLFGYSAEIGAFIAGVVLGNTAYKTDISTRIKPLIIFFNMLFFVGLGFQINLGINTKLLLFIAVLCLLSLIIKPIIVYLTIRSRGYDLKSSFLTGLYLSPLSEFGLIVITAGLSMKLIGDGINSIAIISIILTMILSSYLIKYAQKIYKKIEKPFLIIDSLLFSYLKNKEEQEKEKDFKYNIIFFGYFDLGKELIEKLKKQGKNIIVIENDPEKIEILKNEGWDYIYNSVNNPDFFENIPFEKVEMIISSLIDINDNKMIIKELKRKNPKGVAIVSGKNVTESIELYNHNADYVILTSFLNNQHVTFILEDYTSDLTRIISQKLKDIDKLKEIDKKRKTIQKDKSFINIDYMINDIDKMLKHNPFKNNKKKKDNLETEEKIK
jgi:Kef-type K+ transport system membrane component KefB